MLRKPIGPLSAVNGPAAVVVVAIAALAASVCHGAGEAPYSPWRVVSEGPNHFEISITVPAPIFEPAHIGESEASRIEMPGWPSSAAEGAPMLPLRSLAVAVPEGERFEITVEGEDPIRFSDVHLVPFRSGTLEDFDRDTVPTRAVSDAWYRTDAFLPEVVYEVGPPTYLRDLRVVPVDVRPAKYNAATRELRVFRRLRLRVETRSGVGGPTSLDVAGGVARSGGGMWERIYRGAVVNYPSEMAHRAMRPRRAARSTDSGDYFDSSSRWLAVEVDSRGIYKISYQDILGSGVSEAELAAVDPRTLRLFSGSGLPIDLNESVLDAPSWMTECSIRVEDGGDGSFDPGDKVLFYGLGASGWSDYLEGGSSWREHHENGHTDLNVYWLTWGGSFETGDALRMESRDGEPAGEGIYTPETYTARVHREENFLWDPAPYEAGVKWERWWWQELSMIDSGGRVYSVDLKHVDTNGPCRLKARFWGSDFVWGCPWLPHHLVKLEFNDSDSFFIEGQLDRRMDVDTTAAWAVEGENVLVARVPVLRDTCLENRDPPKRREDKCLFGWFELEYQRRFRAAEDELSFDWFADAGGPTRFEAGGFSTDAVRVLDVTNRYRPEIVNTSAGSGGAVTFQENLEAGRRNYYLAADPALRTPVEISLRSPGSLRTSSETPDYIIVTGEPLGGAAEVLANWRRNHLYGITEDGSAAVVEVADVSDIYDEFSWGLVDPLAIKHFLELRFRSAPAGARPPAYVLLLGDATWDFKDVYRLGVKNIVPAYDELYDWRSRTQYSSDDFFVLFEGAEDRYSDMAIGRVSAETSAEAMDIVTLKIIGFETQGDRGPWRNTVVLAADDACKKTSPEGLGERHTAQAEALSQRYLPEVLDRTKIYMIDYGGPGCRSVSKPEARADFIEALNSGAILVNYVGHGSAGVISDETLLLADDVAALGNGGKFGLFVTASCAVGKYDVPLEIGMAEKMMRHPSAGSLASYAATTLAYIPPNKELNELLVSALLPKTAPADSVRAAPSGSFGLAIMEAEALFTNWEYFTPYKYVLLGDPASVIPAPGTPYYNEGDWMWVDLALSHTDLAGGERDTLRGTVMMGEERASTFQGRVSVVVRGARETRYLPTYGPYYYYGPVFYRGEAKVADGSFEVSWTNPYEMTTGERGRVRAFVWNERDEAAGAIVGLDVTPPAGPKEDKDGPVIDLAFESPGGAVTPGAALRIEISDPAGVNLAPILAENGLFLRLFNDDLSLLVDGPVDLVEGYTYNEGSSSSGSVSYRLPTGLSTEEGANRYRVEVNASDNFSNRSTSELSFEVVEAGDLKLTNVINFPNPFSDETTISFRLPRRADVAVRVYTVGGRMVRKLSSPGVSGWGHVLWDGRDEQGDKVSNGVYIYKITAVSSATGRREEAEAIGRATVIR
jgi:hypothetical protein